MLVVLMLVADADMPRLNNMPLAPAYPQAILDQKRARTVAKSWRRETITALVERSKIWHLVRVTLLSCILF
jgi:hypothetical protein